MSDKIAERRYCLCNNCGYNFKSKLVKPKCPKCRRLTNIKILSPAEVKSIEESEKKETIKKQQPEREDTAKNEQGEEGEEEATEEESQEPKKGRPIAVAYQNVGLDGTTLIELEALRTYGEGNDVKTLVKKSIHLFYALKKGNEVLGVKKTEEGTLDKLMQLKAMMSMFGGEAQAQKQVTPLDDFLKYMELFQKMAPQHNSGNDMMPMMMAMMMSMNSNNKQQPTVDPFKEALKDQIDKLREELTNKQQMQSLIENLGKKKDDNSSLIEVLNKLEVVKNQGASQVEEMKKRLEEERNKSTDYKIEELKSKLVDALASRGGGVGDVIKDKVDKFVADNFEKVLRGNTPGNTPGDMAMDLIKNTIEQIKGPILEPAGQAIADKIRNSTEQGYPQEAIPVPQPSAAPEVSKPKKPRKKKEAQPVVTQTELKPENTQPIVQQIPQDTAKALESAPIKEGITKVETN